MRSAILFMWIAVCWGCSQGMRGAWQVPRYTIAAINLSLGPFRGSLHIGSNIPFNGRGLPSLDLEQLRAALEVPEDTQQQLQLITRSLLETFGLYEPFRKQIKAVVLNNPVYYGEKSGMVNYHKNIFGKTTNVTDVPSTPPNKSFKWDGINGSKPITNRGNGDTKHDWSRVVDQAQNGDTPIKDTTNVYDEVVIKTVD